MEYLISLLQSTKDGNGIFHCRLIYHNRLETTGKCRIFFNILTVLIQSCGTDTVQLTSGKHRLQHISCIHGTICLTGTDDQMKLIDEQNDLSFALLHFLKYCFQTFLKLTTILGTCNQCSHIQGKNLLVLQAFRYIPCHNTLCQSLDGCCFTNTRLTDENRVVLGLTGKDTDNITDLHITADHRIKLLILSFLHKILAIFIQGVIGCLRVIADNSLVSSDCRQCLEKTLSGDSKLIEYLLHARAWITQHGKKQMLNRDILISHSLRFILSTDQRFVQILTKVKLSTGNFNLSIQCFLHCVNKIFLLDLHLLDQFENQAVLLCQQSIQKVFLLDLLIAIFISNLLKILDSLHGFLCKFTDIHRLSSYSMKSTSNTLISEMLWFFLVLGEI